MARKTLTERGDAIVGIYPVDFERGHVKGHPGTRITLCKKSEIAYMSIRERDEHVQDLYYSKKIELKNAFYDKRLNIQTKKKEKKIAYFKEASKLWLSEYDSNKKTFKTYSQTIKLYLNHIGDHRIADFDRDCNIQFYDYLTTYKSHRKPFNVISKDTQNSHMRTLQNFMNWCYDNEYTKKRFFLKKQKKSQKDIHTFTPEEVDKLSSYIKKRAETNIDPRINRMNKNLYRAYMIARHTLVRKGSIWALKLEWIDLERGFIYFQSNPDLGWESKGMKWPNKPINDTLRKFLEDDLKNREPQEKYFVDNGRGKPWYANVDHMSKPMRKACDAAGLPSIVKPFHWGVRGTHITWLLNNGVDVVEVQHLADHSDMATTMGYYDSRTASQAKAVKMLE
ncbi:MAG: tyrosine-type recombinase/integrase [Cycloclasticus sp.]|jgi:Site-specific recombinase XerD